MPTIVEFKADKSDQETVIGVLESALEMARAGRVVDVAVVLALRDEQAGPMHFHSYYGQGAYAVLVAGVASLTWSMQYDAAKQREGRD